MTHAYTEGVQAALTALAWLAGILTVLVWVAATVLLLLVAAVRTSQTIRPWVARRTATRTHARSGRLTGPQ